MKICLIDIDSKIPNLALMKISQYHKKRGDHIELVSPLFAMSSHCDLVYASKIFLDTPMPILPSGTLSGGTGIDLVSALSHVIEHQYPDYALYGCDYAIGYTSRGCNRRCPFCVVPQKEGKWKAWAEIREFWNGQDRIMLLDNSLNTNEEYFMHIADDLIDAQVAVDFSQGLDVRYLTDKQAAKLQKIKLWKRIHFAWDFMGIEKSVRRGIEILIKHGLQHKTMFYVLIGYNTTPEEDLYRVETLRGWGIDPFVMPFNRNRSYQKDFARWVNHKAIFNTVNWENYNGG